MENKERILSPREELKSLEAEGLYVFHGSDVSHIESLKPRQAYTMIDDVLVEDDVPAVHASPSADVAIFMAIINKENCPEGFRSSFSGKDGNITFTATKESLDQLNEGSRGFVYVLPKDEFKMRGDTQAISYVNVSPVKVVKVSKEDLPGNIISD